MLETSQTRSFREITVLKSLIVSQLVYLFFSSSNKSCTIKEINVMFYNFLRNAKGDKINDFSECEKGDLK